MMVNVVLVSIIAGLSFISNDAKEVHIRQLILLPFQMP